jgi:hypothetical protein
MLPWCFDRRKLNTGVVLCCAGAGELRLNIERRHPSRELPEQSFRIGVLPGGTIASASIACSIREMDIQRIVNQPDK